MKQAANFLRNCPPYLLVLLGFCSAVAWGLGRLYAMLRELGLGAA
jgi:hypothetical protein